MLMDRAGTRVHPKSFFQTFLRFGKFTEPIICPAEAVEVRRVRRIDLERLPNEIEGFLHPIVAIEKEITQIVQCYRITRCLFQKLTKRGLGSFYIARHLLRGG